MYVQLEFNNMTLEGELSLLPCAYPDESDALLLYCNDGGPPEKLSINLAAWRPKPKPLHVYVKNYSEHAGLPAALVKSCAMEKVAEVSYGPFDSSAWLLEVKF